jgi:hypothetical protein
VTVTFTVPTSGQNFGPGFLIQATSDVNGPFPVGSFWRVQAFAPTTAEVPFLDTGIDNENFPVLNAKFVTSEGNFVVMPTPHHLTRMGATVRVQADLTTPSGVEDTGSVEVTWDPTTGVIWGLNQRLQGTSSGGLTEDQAEQLELASTAPTRLFGIGTDVVNVPIGDLLSHPPLGLMAIDPDPIVVSGDGVLDGDDNLLPAIYGLWWEALLVPPEVGRVLGPTVRYQQRLVQLRTIHTVDGVDFVTEVLDADFERVVWLWSHAKPTRVEFSVMPGAQVAFHYVNFRLP